MVILGWSVKLGRILVTQIKPIKLVLSVLLATLVFRPKSGLDIRVASKTDNTDFINFIGVIDILPSSGRSPLIEK